MHGARRIGAWFVVLLCGLWITGCTTAGRAPILTRNTEPSRPPPVANMQGVPEPAKVPSAKPAGYRVVRGDTLYSIAWKFGVDHRALARWNGIGDPDRIYVGQVLKLAPGADTARPVTPRPAVHHVVPGPAVARERTVGKPVTAAPRAVTARRPAAIDAASRLRWIWPAEGRIKMTTSGLGGNPAVEIHGNKGDAVRAAAGGQVVYSGSGLRGYGQLIIIKHSDVFLSAYAHNDKLLVAEGANVESGEAIAEMGNSEAENVMLHFEIRRNGKAVEPLEYLPRR